MQVKTDELFQDRKRMHRISGHRTGDSLRFCGSGKAFGKVVDVQIGFVQPEGGVSKFANEKSINL